MVEPGAWFCFGVEKKKQKKKFYVISSEEAL
jgi:hypothetical protein